MSWSIQLPGLTKAGAAVAIGNVTAAQCVFSDLAGSNDTQFAASLSAAKSAATALVAGLTNANALRLTVQMGGTHDHNLAAPLPGAAAGEAWVTIVEQWP